VLSAGEGVTGLMVIKGALGAGFGITTSPYTGINRVDGFSCFQRMLRKQPFDCLTVDLSIGQCLFTVLSVFLPEPRRSSPLEQILRGYWLS
jgi:hypothetical protein